MLFSLKTTSRTDMTEKDILTDTHELQKRMADKGKKVGKLMA